jgi:uncharacterized protein (TIGR03790 family)
MNRYFFLSIALNFVPFFHATSDIPGDRVVVLANRNMPESIELARYYMGAREIPAAHLCLLDLPEGEVISRANYVSRLRDPLLAFLRKQRLITQEPRPSGEVQAYETAWITTTSSVHYVVSMYGVPLRIADTRFRIAARIADRLGNPSYKNEAAVDSELSLLLMAPYDLPGPFTNPMFHSLGVSRAMGKNQYLLIAARLDGPDASSVKTMIDNTLHAERYGLAGRAYFDARGLPGGAYYVGDYWIREAYERFLRAGYDCMLDMREQVWEEHYPMEQVAFYAGWYEEHVKGPFTRDSFTFMPGALAYHIHSGSAKSIREKERYWAGPLLHQGAVATMGAVAEPFLQFTPDVHVWADRLISGYPMGEAAYMAQSVLSWQITVIGDPLYRPFRYALHEQIEHIKADKKPGLDWATLRRVNLLVREGRFNIALNLCRSHLQENESIVLREKLGDLYAINDITHEALRQYDRVLELAQTPETAARVGARMLTLLRLMEQDKAVTDLYERLQREWEQHPMMEWLDHAVQEK